MNIENAFEPTKRFLGVIGASVGGLTAIFYVVGFLAMHAHNRFLGLTHISIDFNEYLFNGGQFFAYLPHLAVYFLDLLLAFAENDFGLLVIIIIAIAILWLLLQIRFIKNIKNRLIPLVNSIAKRFIFIQQVIFNLALLILFITISLDVVEQNGFLFNDITHNDYWLIDASNEGFSRRQQYFSGLLIMAILSLLTYAMLEKWRQQPVESNNPVKAPWRSIFSVSALLLIILQLLYLPVNYGILIISNYYPTVEFDLKKGMPEGFLKEGNPLVLIHREGDDYFFYSRRQMKTWQFHRSDFSWLTRMKEVNIFEQSDYKNKGLPNEQE